MIKYILIGLILAGTMAACDKRTNPIPLEAAPGPAVESAPLVHIVYDADDSLSVVMFDHLEEILASSKLPYSATDLQSAPASIPETARTTFLTTNPEQSDSTYIREFVPYVNAGNNMIITRPIWNPELMFLMGIRPNVAPQTDSTARGVIFDREIFPGFRGEADSLGWSDAHGGFSGDTFKAGVEVIATATSPRSYPVITEHRIGGGRVYLYNSYTFGNFLFRHAFFSNLLRTLPGIPYPVSNVSTIFLDDFPAPYYNTLEQPIAEEYGITQAEFVHDIWWPDMKELADSLRITYTTALVFNYNQRMLPPFNFDEWRIGKVEAEPEVRDVSPLLTEDVMQSRHELGFHGYNHISLERAPWKMPRYMFLAAEAARRMWLIEGYGDYPVTYIPPHNIIDSTGIRNLVKGMPALRILSSIKQGRVAEGGGRGFGEDPYAPALYTYPRTTDGYYNLNRSIFTQHGQLLQHGVWNHFIHPDDVYDTDEGGKYEEFDPRNPLNLGWKSGLGRGRTGLFPLFKKRLEDTRDWYPLLRFLPAHRGAEIVRQLQHTPYQYRISEDSVRLRAIESVPGSGTKYWFMYVPGEDDPQMQELVRELSIDFAKTSIWEGHLYQFSTEQAGLALPRLSPSRSRSRSLTIEALNAQVENYKQVRNNVQNPGLSFTVRGLDSLKEAYAQNPQSDQLLAEIVRVAAGIDQTEAVIPLLEERILNQRQWDPMQIERLLTFYGWEGQPEASWELLERRWPQYPDTTTLQLRDTVASRYGWPDLPTQRTWLLREHELFPERVDINQRVAWTFATDSTWDIAKNAAQELIRTVPRSDTLYAFTLQRSFWYDSTEATLELVEQFPPRTYEQLRPFADELAYLYAGQQNYVRAVQWADRAFVFDPSTRFYWQQLRADTDSAQFRSRGLRALQQNPQSDSLRSYIGLNLLYQGFRKEAYSVLRPFLENQKPDSVDRVIHTEVGYMPYQERLDLYQSYPSFFNDTLRSQLYEQYAANHRFSVNPYGSYRTDNFDNTVAEAGLRTRLQSGGSGIHTLALSNLFVGSRVSRQLREERLYKINYDYGRSFMQERLQVHMGGGVQYRRDRFFSSVKTGFAYAGDRSYTSSEFSFNPVYTNAAIEADIKELRTTIYREDRWVDQYFRTALSGQARYYSDRVFHYEAGMTGFIFPFDIGLVELSPTAYISYADATVHRNSGIPYFTPDNLITSGGGLAASYVLPESSTDIRIQTRANHDKDTPVFGSLNASVSAPLTDYASIELGGYFSSSEAYQSNQFSFSLRFDIPRGFPEPERKDRRSPSDRSLPTRETVLPDLAGRRTQSPLYHILGQISLPDSVASVGLHNHRVYYRRVDGRREGMVKTYYDGSFFIENMVEGAYRLWLHPADSTFRAAEDTTLVELHPPLEQQVRTGVEFVVHPRTEVRREASGESYSVELGREETLPEAIALVRRHQQKHNIIASLFYDQQQNQIVLRGDESFASREKAAGWIRDKNGAMEHATSVYSTDADSNMVPVTYRFQFGSFTDRDHAREFAAGIREKIDEYEISLSIDPVRGLYIVGTGEMSDWHRSREKLNELRQVVGESSVFRNIKPRNL
ncbi:DUF2194 domain-containing protein [Fodinibius sediminis]|uniref:SPOR domain-containing protein n=1 Tax=Fodinibius sediminis TaxID=1214077 RepID=A0A521CNZ7_9BACT|nr:DUF2194 domain-containing protein [Fodinibius sediminis]SMO60390.1 hypothetical protein SAMN06265218_106189 [Fodinibius sediminis]